MSCGRRCRSSANGTNRQRTTDNRPRTRSSVLSVVLLLKPCRASSSCRSAGRRSGSRGRSSKTRVLARRIDGGEVCDRRFMRLRAVDNQTSGSAGFRAPRRNNLKHPLDHRTCTSPNYVRNQRHQRELRTAYIRVLTRATSTTLANLSRCVLPILGSGGIADVTCRSIKRRWRGARPARLVEAGAMAAWCPRRLLCGLKSDPHLGRFGAPMRSRRSDSDRPPPTNIITAPSQISNTSGLK